MRPKSKGQHSIQVFTKTEIGFLKTVKSIPEERELLVFDTWIIIGDAAIDMYSRLFNLSSPLEISSLTVRTVPFVRSMRGNLLVRR
mmetsp:Transcript_13303/g.30624  ORF Transcript_13303/g.30624 Transcript_13303/m.30624 type:complete len:86 (+) Transcript_13303:2549-2806(+)